MTHASPQAFKDAVPALADLKPRVRVEVVVELTGLKRRTITDLALKDKIPGAVKHGETWTFDQDLLAVWITKGNNENGGEKVGHGSGGMTLLRAA